MSALVLTREHGRKMFEFEAGVTQLRMAYLDTSHPSLEEVLGAKVVRQSLTVWQEHCSECAMPDCYSRCGFYSPRPDYKCRRFPGGVGIYAPTNSAASPMVMTFGRWARLLGHGPTPLVSPKRAARKERNALRFAQVLGAFPRMRGLVAPIRRRLVNRRSTEVSWGVTEREHLFFLIEANNPTSATIELSLSCKVLDADDAPGTYHRELLRFAPGYGIRLIPVAAFVPEEFQGRKFAMELAAAKDGDTPTIAFGLLDIVELDRKPPSIQAPPRKAEVLVERTAPKIKCVVWDLDNTLWEGVLVEDGLERLRLHPKVVSLILDLDRKGVLQSVASKNAPEAAMAALSHFGLTEYFIHPQISWGAKSDAIAEIRQMLNIGLDTFAFVDDQEFERCEVKTAHPDVLVLDANSLDEIHVNERFNIEVSDESKGRRELYLQEGERQSALAKSGEGYEEFLKTCNLHVEIEFLTNDHLPRASELAQRTNQLNIGNSRYTLEHLRKLMGDKEHSVLVVRASDRFGSYGVVGLCVIDSDRRLILDLMFSCRIQSKLVDDTFLAWLADQYGDPMWARFIETKKNEPAKALLQRCGFKFHERHPDGELWLRERVPRTLADLRDIVTVTVPSENDSH